MSYEDLGKHFDEPIGQSLAELEVVSREKINQFLREASKDIAEICGANVLDVNQLAVGLVGLRVQHLHTLLSVKAIQESAAGICTELDAIWDPEPDVVVQDKEPDGVNGVVQDPQQDGDVYKQPRAWLV